MSTHSASDITVSEPEDEDQSKASGNGKEAKGQQSRTIFVGDKDKDKDKDKNKNKNKNKDKDKDKASKRNTSPQTVLRKKTTERQNASGDSSSPSSISISAVSALPSSRHRNSTGSTSIKKADNSAMFRKHKGSDNSSSNNNSNNDSNSNNNSNNDSNSNNDKGQIVHDSSNGTAQKSGRNSRNSLGKSGEGLKLTFTYPKAHGHIFNVDGKKGEIRFEYNLNNPELFARRALIDIVH
ncbi:hypothetical protein RFI_40090, partial [Reticulomyxa filosa]